MIKVCTSEKDIPRQIKEELLLESNDWEYIVIPDSYKEIKAAEKIIRLICSQDYTKVETKDRKVFFVSYYVS